VGTLSFSTTNTIRPLFLRPTQCASGADIGKRKAKNQDNVTCFITNAKNQIIQDGVTVGVSGMKLIVNGAEKILIIK